MTTSEVSKKMQELGFELSVGKEDFSFDWKDKQPTGEEILARGDKVVEALSGSGCVFKFHTY